MWVSKVVLNHIRSFENETIELSKGINLLVGPNNSGKSTIAHAILSIQEGYSLGSQDIRVGQKMGNAEIYFEGRDKNSFYPSDLSKVVVTLKEAAGTTLTGTSKEGVGVRQIVAVEPQNFIYPYLSKRKVGGYAEQINLQFTNQVTGNLQNLYAKLDRISNPQLPAYEDYMKACQKTLGLIITCLSSPSGKKACYVIGNFTSITIDKMGEGVASILGLLVDLCIAENRLFVIEEPENDIHPKALKGVLELIIEKSKNNQFIITTHSNIVTRYLGSEVGTKIFSVSITFDSEKIPCSKLEEISNSVESRRDLLEDLGYELCDFDLWEGWLFLEEASAEKVIRQYLIPWFATKLQGRVRTFSARSVSEVESKFEAFNRLFSYLNLEPTYKNRAWVIVDGGEQEKAIIEKLGQVYMKNGWGKDQFLQFGEHDFERYYPAKFDQKVEEILKVADKGERRKQKKALLEEVELWINSNEKDATEGFEKSASEVIMKLKAIEEKMMVKT